MHFTNHTKALHLLLIEVEAVVNLRPMATETTNNVQNHVPPSPFNFLNEVESCYASTWKLLTSRYQLPQTLEKNTTHSKRILGKMAQGVHSYTKTAKIVQKETEKLSDGRRCFSKTRIQLK